MERLRTDGKFFRAGEHRVHLRTVTYGPFPGGWPAAPGEDFSRIAAAGFNSLRLYQMPGADLLDAARQHGLRVFAGLEWATSMDFLRRPDLLASAQVELSEALRDIHLHPALAGVYVGNEIPADLARWMDPVKVRRILEDLITLGRSIAPDLLFAYGNFPSTEYLEPENADFTAFNLYLEEPAALRRYLRRLHHIAGDRPVVVSEFGLDTRRNPLERQASLLSEAVRIASDEEAAGFTVYAWSDRWWANGEVTDWDFGLTDRSGLAKPALAAVRAAFLALDEPQPAPDVLVSVIVCTRNGRERIGGCLEAVARMDDRCFETLVVDDGSTDGTADHVADAYPFVKLLRLPHGGLSAARNAGAAAAGGEILAFTDDDCEPDREWISRLRRGFSQGRFDAAGGPNLPPQPRSRVEAIVSSAPGAPSHVMLDDQEAEHLPGCNLAVTKAAFDAVGGFDPQFHVAGDDVDFCWRLKDAGFRLGFVPGAFVWHWRRPSLRAYLRQQRGYGRAERLLLSKHPVRFTSHGQTIWHGFVYNGGPLRAVEDSLIYYGPMGTAGYQSVSAGVMPLRALAPGYDRALSGAVLAVLGWIQPRLRAWERIRSIRLWSPSAARAEPGDFREIELWSESGKSREAWLSELLGRGWQACGETEPWDLHKDGTRLLLATERGTGPWSNTLVRIEGPLTPDFSG